MGVSTKDTLVWVFNLVEAKVREAEYELKMMRHAARPLNADGDKRSAGFVQRCAERIPAMEAKVAEWTAHRDNLASLIGYALLPKVGEDQ